MRIKIKNELFLLKHRTLVKTAGIQSTAKGGHVLFLEYDDVSPKKWISTREILKRIQAEFKISDMFLFESSKNSYHVISPDKMSFGEVMEIQNRFREFMRLYMSRSALRGYCVLRFDKKGDKPQPKLVEIWRQEGDRTKSLAHVQFLEKWYNIESNGKTDRNSTLKYDIYETVKSREKNDL